LRLNNIVKRIAFNSHSVGDLLVADGDTPRGDHHPDFFFKIVEKLECAHDFIVKAVPREHTKITKFLTTDQSARPIWFRAKLPEEK